MKILISILLIFAEGDLSDLHFNFIPQYIYMYTDEKRWKKKFSFMWPQGVKYKRIKEKAKSLCDPGIPKMLFLFTLFKIMWIYYIPSGTSGGDVFLFLNFFY